MTRPPAKLLMSARFIEFSLAIAVIASLFHLVEVLRLSGFLPAPFVYDVSDTFMDWFNPAYWSHNPGAYEVWNSVYAPLSFVILRIVGAPACYANAPKDARDCDLIGIVAILVIYAACAVAAAIVFYRRDRATAVFRSVGFGLGLPLLYGLERGNLIMIALFAFILLFGEMLKSRRAVALAAAVLINLKSYLLLPVLPFAVKREWRTLELCGFAAVGLYLATVVIVGGGTPFELIDNLKIWFNAMSGVVWDQVLYSPTYAPFLQFDERQYPIRDFIPQRTVDVAKLLIEIELVASRSLAFLCIACSWLYPRAITTQRLVLFVIMQSFVAQNPGGYAMTFVIFLVFMERWDGPCTGLAIVMAYLLSIPADMLIGNFYVYERESWLGGRLVESTYGMSVGALVRPGLFALILWLLGIDSLIRFHRAARTSRANFGLAGEQLPSAPPAAATTAS